MKRGKQGELKDITVSIFESERDEIDAFIASGQSGFPSRSRFMVYHSLAAVRHAKRKEER